MSGNVYGSSGENGHVPYARPVEILFSLTVAWRGTRSAMADRELVVELAGAVVA
jgi:hypothetical protein